MPGRSSNSAGARFEYNGQMKDNDITPYQFAGNTPIQAIDLDGEEPESVVDVKHQWTESEKVYYNGGMDHTYVNIVHYEYAYTIPVAHLLSLVSGVTESEIRKITIQKTNSLINYDANKGGGITMLDNSGGCHPYLTANYFKPVPDESDFNTDYSKDDPIAVFNWLWLASHESTYFKDVKEIQPNGIPNKDSYLLYFSFHYIKNLGHSHSWREKRADRSAFKFEDFNRFIEGHIAKGALFILLTNHKINDNAKITILNSW